ncbi:hypothetical protein O6P43_020961 [Quillaja saponaria]|uniref:Uncharacterized protein n=1 Tax=Quillaja saponaria TaxID=32244 RepID=A0AAD7LLU7_QUISA|nr:hypothetical protein O6P43_020961 [Quillaja saponaria]
MDIMDNGEGTKAGDCGFKELNELLSQRINGATRYTKPDQEEQRKTNQKCQQSTISVVRLKYESKGSEIHNIRRKDTHQVFDEFPNENATAFVAPKLKETEITELVSPPEIN